jgi:hypothetical protein
MLDRGIELAGFELTGFPLIPKPWKTRRSVVSYGRQVATEPARLLRCEVLLQTLTLNPVNVRGGEKERRGEFILYIHLCQVKYAAFTHAKGRVTRCGVFDSCQTANHSRLHVRLGKSMRLI